MAEDTGFQKISFSSQVKKAHANKMRLPGFKNRRILLTCLGIFIAVPVVLAAAVFFPARKIMSDAQKARVTANEVYTLGKNQDLDGVKIKAAQLKGDLENLSSSIDSLKWLAFVPVAGGFQKDGQHLVAAGISSVEALQIAVDTVIPYSDLLGLKGQSKFVSGSADDRIRTAVETIDKIVPSIDKIASSLKEADGQLSKVDFTRYPKKIGSTPLRDQLVSGKQLFEDTTSLFVDAAPLLKKIPDLLGNREGKKYLFLFQNDAELRATGGFMTAFAIFDVNKGKLTVERSDDIYKLDEAKKRNFPAPEKILTYHKGVSQYQLRDSNLSPDFKESMAAFEKLLSDSSVDLGEYDGIIAMDTHVLVETVRILGEFNAAGRSFSAEIDPRCDCPKVIYELEDYATRPVAFIRTDRKGVIGDLLYQILQRALGVSPSQYWGRLFQMFLDESGEKHILFYFRDNEAQTGIESINFGGRIKDFKGDYLHVSNVNFAGAKSNLFVKNDVVSKIEKEGSKLVKTVTLTYRNPAKASNCNLEAGQLCLNGILRNWIRVYVPKGSTLLDFKGSEMKTQVYEELGKTVFEGFLTVKPEGKAEAVIKYSLPGSVSDDPYSLLIQKQPGTTGEQFTVNYLGREEKFILETDKELKF